MLRALKQRLAPSDEARNLGIEQRYHKLCKGPGTQNIDTWLDDWTTTYTEAKEHGIAEATGTRPIRDFLMAAGSKEPTFADAHPLRIRMHKTTYDFYSLIKDFRLHIRLPKINQPSESNTHSAFAANSTKLSNNASFRGQPLSGPPKPCVCGDTHWFSDCYYLVP